MESVILGTSGILLLLYFYENTKKNIVQLKKNIVDEKEKLIAGYEEQKKYIKEQVDSAQQNYKKYVFWQGVSTVGGLLFSAGTLYFNNAKKRGSYLERITEI